MCQNELIEPAIDEDGDGAGRINGFVTKQVVDVAPTNPCRRRFCSSSTQPAREHTHTIWGQVELPLYTSLCAALSSLSASRWSVWPRGERHVVPMLLLCSHPDIAHCYRGLTRLVIGVSMRSLDHDLRMDFQAYSCRHSFLSLSVSHSHFKPLNTFFCSIVLCSEDEERLVRDLFRDYNKLIRPVETLNETVVVK